jgi:hypothetical protein
MLTGNVAVGNLSKMLPFVLLEIESQPKRQYLLLHSLKEVKHHVCVVGKWRLMDFFAVLCIILADSFCTDIRNFEYHLW